MRIERGLVHVYTGDGKGKTTAALGLALRALGWGLRVMMIQYIKGYADLGEIKFAKEYGKNFAMHQFALDTSRDIPEEKVKARQAEVEKAMEFAEHAVNSGEYDLVILDELNVAIHYGLVDVKRVVELVEGKPASVELVVTGRNAPGQLAALADYVTESLMVKHPFEQGTMARPGIDY